MTVDNKRSECTEVEDTWILFALSKRHKACMSRAPRRTLSDASRDLNAFQQYIYLTDGAHIVRQLQDHHCVNEGSGTATVSVKVKKKDIARKCFTV